MTKGHFNIARSENGAIVVTEYLPGPSAPKIWAFEDPEEAAAFIRSRIVAEKKELCDGANG